MGRVRERLEKLTWEWEDGVIEDGGGCVAGATGRGGEGAVSKVR